MGADPLKREYGVMLGVTGPILLERAVMFRELSAVIRRELGDESEAAGWMDMQAQRAEETIVNLARKFDGRQN